jgi:lysophospholipase L1-like esterase
LTLTAILLGSACIPSRAPLPDAAGFSLVGFGDSLTVGGAPDASYLSHLPPEWSPTNQGDWSEFGVTGQRRLQSAIPSLVDHDVEVVVLMWGTNDAYSPLVDRNGPKEWRDELVDETVRSIEQLVAAGITPVVAFPPPSVAPTPHGAIANTRLEELEWLIAMESIGRDVAFVDLYAAFLDEPDPSAYFAADGVHLNADGAAFAARQIERVVAPLYDRWFEGVEAP